MRGNSRVRFPHTISYRLTDEDYLKLQREIHNTGLTPHDWCRLVVLDRLNNEFGLSRKERYFLHQILRTQWLVAHGFHLLADDRLAVERWRRFRDFARQNVERFVKLSSDEFQLVLESKRHQNPIDAANVTTVTPVFDED